MRTATDRATAERGDPWIARYTGLAADLGIVDGSPLDRIGAWAQAQTPQNDSGRLATRRAGWPVLEIDALRSADGGLAEAWSLLTR